MKQNNRFGTASLTRLGWKWLLLLMSLAVLTAWLSINVASSKASTDKSSLNFGSVSVGQSASAQNLTFNPNNYLSSFNTSIGGSNASDFGVIAEKSCASLYFQQTCKISVSFKPNVGGSRAAVLILQYTDYNGVLYTEKINLSGIGLDLVVQGRVYGQVTFKGKPLTNMADVTVSLSGTSSGSPVKSGPQQVDSSGKYGFNNLAKGIYTVTLNIPAGVQIDGPPSYQIDMLQSVKDTQVNFNLTDTPPPTTLPPPSSKAENCEKNVAPVSGVVDIITCLQATNANGRNNLRYILRNNSSEAVDVRNSVIVIS